MVNIIKKNSLILLNFIVIIYYYYCCFYLFYLAANVRDMLLPFTLKGPVKRHCLLNNSLKD